MLHTYFAMLFTLLFGCYYYYTKYFLNYKSFAKFCVYFPVEPNPPSPRTVSDSVSVSSNSA